MPKKITLKKAVDMIPNWSMIFIGGFGYSRSCMAFCREMIRQEKHDFHFVSTSPTLHSDLLAGGRVIKFMEVGGLGVERGNTNGFFKKSVNSDKKPDHTFNCTDSTYVFPNLSRRVKERFLKIEDYSNLSMIMRFYGGAIGVPFMPIKSLFGSDIINKSSYKYLKEKLSIVECPFTETPVCLVPSINPDFGVIQVQRCDEDGNVQIDDALASDVDGLKSSDIKIVLAEEIISSKETYKNPSFTKIPGILVDFIVECPNGAWPTAMFNYYDYDKEHIDYYLDLCSTEDGFEKYKKEWVMPSEDTILNKISAKKK